MERYHNPNMNKHLTSTRAFQTAVHESGHALVGHELGIPVTKLTLNRADNSGHCDFLYDRAPLHDYAAMILAGDEAERQVLGKRVSNTPTDEADLERLYLTNYQRQHAEMLARRLVTQHSERIERLAKVLDYAEDLEGDRLQKILALQPGQRIERTATQPADDTPATLDAAERMLKTLTREIAACGLEHRALHAEFAGYRAQLESLDAGDRMAKRALPVPEVFACGKELDSGRGFTIPERRAPVWNWRAGRYV